MPAEEDVGPAPDPVLVGGTVHIGHAVDSQSQAADFGTYLTYTTPAGPDIPRQILPYDSNRHRAVVAVGPAAPAALTATSSNPPVTTPAASTVLATVPLTAGITYTAAWVCQLEGTPAAGTDDDNFSLYYGATLLSSLNPAVAGLYPQLPYTFTPATSASLQVRVRVLGTAGAIYAAQLSCNAAPAGGAGIWVGAQGQVQASPPLGGWIPAGQQMVMEHNAAVWMTGDGANALKVTVAMERWA